MILDDLTQAVGDTPLLRLTRFTADAAADAGAERGAEAGVEAGAEILAKLELFNPYSVKDRPVLAMIDAAARDGRLAPGGTVVEATSGNTGMALAMVCAVRGYRCILVMSEIQSRERRQVLAALGADLVLTPKEKGTRGARDEARRIARETGALYLGQHDNPANPRAHEETTAEELWRGTGGRIDALVAGLGTGGTLCGVARALCARKPSFRLFGVEPAESPFISQGVFRPHRMMGTAPGFVPGVLERELLDEILLVSEEEAFAACRRLARTEGLLAGISSGAVAHACVQLAARPEWRGKLIVGLFADTGQRYLSVEGLFPFPSYGCEVQSSLGMAIKTAEQLARAGALGRCELISGQLHPMIPAGDEHGRITAHLTYAVARHVISRKLGVLHGAETGFLLTRDPDTVRAPDLAFTRAERAAPPTRGFVPVAPDLAVEVFSPSDRPAYAREKVAAWLEAGTLAVWVVDPHARTVTVHEPGRPPSVHPEAGRLPGGELLPGFELAVRDLFS